MAGPVQQTIKAPSLPKIGGVGGQNHIKHKISLRQFPKMRKSSRCEPRSEKRPERELGPLIRASSALCCEADAEPGSPLVQLSVVPADS